MSTMLVLRHAAAVSFAAQDHDRPLSADGLRDAETVGAALAALQPPDQALVSSARRAQETFLAARDSGGWSLDPQVVGGLYGGDPHDVIGEVAAGATTSGTLLLVGHEPWCSELIAMLTGARVRMETAAVACLQVGPSWDALDPDWCTLRWLAPPRVLAALSRRSTAAGGS